MDEMGLWAGVERHPGVGLLGGDGAELGPGAEPRSALSLPLRVEQVLVAGMWGVDHGSDPGPALSPEVCHNPTS